MADELDYYAVLGVPTDADADAIRLAYRRLARRYHPDVAGTGSVSQMQALNSAYRVLSDPQRRRAYDAGRGIVPAAPPAPPPAHRPPPMSPVPGRVGAVRASDGPLRRVAVLEARAAPIVALAFSAFPADAARVALGLIDGRVALWDVAGARPTANFDFGGDAGAGVLQDIRVSPGGAVVAAWGFSLGLRCWRVGEGGALLWNTAISAPSGLLDVAVADDPPFAALALPDAPLALADDDPFRWAHEGRAGTAVYFRPLAGPVSPAWAVPLRCAEAPDAGRPRLPQGGGPRVHARILSADGKLLLTLSSSGTPDTPQTRSIALWELTHRTRRGQIEPRRLARVAEPEHAQGLPLAATSDLRLVALGDGSGRVRLVAPREGRGRIIETGASSEETRDARAALSPDGTLLALAAGAHLALWETLGARRLQYWEFGGEITALAFAPNDARPVLGVGLATGLAELWG